VLSDKRGAFKRLFGSGSIRLPPDQSDDDWNFCIEPPPAPAGIGIVAPDGRMDWIYQGIWI